MRIALSFKESLFGEALACLLEERRAWTPSFVAPGVTEAIRLASEHPVQTLLVDTLGLKAEELQALVELQACGETAVVLIVAEPEPGAYLDLPVERVVSRAASSDALFAVLDEIAATLRPRRFGTPLPFELTQRELECAQLVSKGLSNRRIAELTGLREQSVKNVVSISMRKMAVRNRVQIALRLVQAGLAETPVVQAVVTISASKRVVEPEKVGAGSE